VESYVKNWGMTYTYTKRQTFTHQSHQCTYHSQTLNIVVKWIIVPTLQFTVLSTLCCHYLFLLLIFENPKMLFGFRFAHKITIKCMKEMEQSSLIHVGMILFFITKSIHWSSPFFGTYLSHTCTHYSFIIFS
jgi:hypothetical protein